MNVTTKRDYGSLANVAAAGVLVLLVTGFLVLGRPTAPAVPTTTISPAEALFRDYGGSLAEYQRIFGLSDCGALQAEYDEHLTAQNNAVDGTSAYFVADGYKRAAAQRMQTMGCLG